MIVSIIVNIQNDIYNLWTNTSKQKRIFPIAQHSIESFSACKVTITSTAYTLFSLNFYQEKKIEEKSSKIHFNGSIGVKSFLFFLLFLRWIFIIFAIGKKSISHSMNLSLGLWYSICDFWQKSKHLQTLYSMKLNDLLWYSFERWEKNTMSQMWIVLSRNQFQHTVSMRELVATH